MSSIFFFLNAESLTATEIPFTNTRIFLTSKSHGFMSLCHSYVSLLNQYQSFPPNQTFLTTIFFSFFLFLPQLSLHRCQILLHYYPPSLLIRVFLKSESLTSTRSILISESPSLLPEASLLSPECFSPLILPHY